MSYVPCTRACSRSPSDARSASCASSMAIASPSASGAPGATSVPHRPSSSTSAHWPTVVATVAAASFVGTSVFALTGLALQDPVVGVGETIQVLAVALVWDVLLTPFVLPPLMRLFARLSPQWATT